MIQDNTPFTNTIANKTEVDNLANLVDDVLSKNMSIVTYSKLLDYNNESQKRSLILTK